ncbi:helix-turn-helix domain-containing protein [Mycobacterium montefiorense]|uniref:Transcription regulator protein n=1 Tax=Mycobacterium montefiorense TaxID=154654 RepID=A0AA37PIU5_9MYCO|nr:XRE family transcriptional regulator [Mycobacterium montefiorense]GBG38284.1 putative transcription regulator protein [Mycobacterium montefiorense]GKU36176.1 putative transcription regulator protein [Mycobacterium montefiorense]GKU38731.1 putative transcription regulator protein [Mycobacterium montefiorense]GKU48247.1 putative transcription regulator protein [Mycobacterium montefiorense]GKU53920.1 putative transcription regulator protein [Mycobacterium montefiorense]
MTALLRAVRRQRGLTLEQLAAQTGLTKSYLSKIERRQSTPSIAVALKLARALQVDVGRLFSDDAAEEKITVDRAAGADGQRYRVLASALLGKSMSPFVVRPTATAADNPHAEHTGQEFVFVHAGRIELDYGDQIIKLDTGDSAYFDAAVSHQIRAIGSDPAEVVVVAQTEPR